ncbi:hypothetical protein AB5N19_11713 [Seiridium cardinale]|uniref:Uncharacterized protein n=1 Tax=Seiridium cardinale TaxID=138064 RepID=A0ABR2XEP9_9PEZI
MAQQPPNYEDPPPYSAQDQDCADELVDPTILILVGSSVHAEAATSPPLYSLSHSIDSLTGSESLVVLERYINTVRTGADEVPRIACRKRHIYDLKHLPPVLSPNFAFVLGAVSRRWCIGNIGFRKSARPGQGFKAVTTRPVKSDRFPKGYQARQPSEKEIDQIFGVKIRQNTYEWHTLDGGLVAVEDGRDDQQRLIITAPLTRRIVDALVGCWCLRIWYNNIEIQKGSQKWSKSIHFSLFLSAQFITDYAQ